MAQPRHIQRLAATAISRIPKAHTPTPKRPTPPCPLVAPLAAGFLSFSTTTRTPYRQPPVPGSSLPIPSPRAHSSQNHIPAYPPGERQVYKQSNMGLYGTARIRFGNIVSEGRFQDTKARRSWRPNVHNKRLWSPALGVFVRTRVTTRVLRTIDRCGGLDEYLLGGKQARIEELGPWGWKLRWRLMRTPAVKERFLAERIALGLKKVYDPNGTQEDIEAGEEAAGEAAEVVEQPSETKPAPTKKAPKAAAPIRKAAKGVKSAPSTTAAKGAQKKKKVAPKEIAIGGVPPENAEFMREH